MNLMWILIAAVIISRCHNMRSMPRVWCGISPNTCGATQAVVDGMVDGAVEEVWWTGKEEESVVERVVLVRGGGVMSSRPWFCVWKSAVCVPSGGAILARLDCILAIIAVI
jgi:hypothetical protein